LHDGQEVFRPKQCIALQIQLLVSILEDARLTSKKIYVMHIAFKNAFGSIDHPRLLASMSDPYTFKMLPI